MNADKYGLQIKHAFDNYMKLYAAVTVKKLNVEHRTSNIDGASLYLF